MISLKKLKISFLGAIACCFVLESLQAQTRYARPKVEPKEMLDIKYGPIVTPHRKDAAMEAFRSYGVGQFIHWGIYAIPGNEWEGYHYRGAAEWIRSWGGASAPPNWASTYDNLYKQFNPKDFDAKKWAKQAKDMGAKYLIFTTKHHDGFALWPTKFSDYNISKSPYKKDIVKEIVDAYTAEGIDVFLYFSVMEWNNKDYMSKEPKTAEEKKTFDKFLTYTKNQIFELLGNYPSVKGLWFDGTWDASWVKSYEYTYQLEKDIRAKYPNIIIGSRFRNDETGDRHFDRNQRLMGDYEQVWERKLPKEYSWLGGNDWEAVMTITPGDWGYTKDWDKKYIKTNNDIIGLLMKTVSMNGNFVLNFAPDGAGNMHPGEDKIAKELGEWIAVNKEAVYGAKYSEAYRTTDYGYYTQKGNTLYLTVFNRPVNNIVRIIAEKEVKEVPQTASLLLNGEALSVKQAHIGYDADSNRYYDITLPESLKSTQPFVIKINLQSTSAATEKKEEAKM